MFGVRVKNARKIRHRHLRTCYDYLVRRINKTRMPMYVHNTTFDVMRTAKSRGVRMGKGKGKPAG